ncbi:MAG: vWA domain-containing protein [Myxococcota bacterium]
MRTTRAPILAGLGSLLLLACEASGPFHESESRKEEAPAVASSKAPGYPAPSADKAAAMPRGEDARAAEPAARSDLMPLDGAPEARDERAHYDDRARQQPAPGPGRLTAGQWSDRDDWPRWQRLLAPGSIHHQALGEWSIPHRDRVSVTLRGDDFVPADTLVVLQDPSGRSLWQARTDNEGRVDLFLPAGQSGQVFVAGPGRVATRNVKAGEDHVLRVETPTSVVSALDLMFVVDTTGSMSDELQYLQAELSSIVQRVRHGAAQDYEVRTSVNFFRDNGDEYRLRSFPFTADTSRSLSQLRAQTTGGGGDYPEALAAALADGVDRHRWSRSAVARIMFVITDAPPHPGSRVGRQLESTIAHAADKGIRIVPIASSGVNKPTEFILRHLAVSTGGRYVFLTDHSGIGNSHIEPTVGPHTIEPLDDLLVELIEDYTDHDQLSLIDPRTVDNHPAEARAPHAMAYARHDGPSPWWLLGLGLLVPGFVAGRRWARVTRVPAVSDPRVARARRMLRELNRHDRGASTTDAGSWHAQMQEVVEGMEQLVRQQQAISTSLRVAGALPEEAGSEGVRSSLRSEVERRRTAIDSEIDAGLVSVEAAYLHVISGVGESSATQASLDAAREALQTRIDVDRELRG